MVRFIWKTRGPTGFLPGCLVWEFIRPVPKAGPLLVAGLSPSLSILPISIFAAWSETLPLCRGSPASAILFNQSPPVPPPSFDRSLEVPPPHVAQPRDLCSPFAPILALKSSLPPPWVVSTQTPVHPWRLGKLWGDPQARERGV